MQIKIVIFCFSSFCQKQDIRITKPGRALMLDYRSIVSCFASLINVLSTEKTAKLSWRTKQSYCNVRKKIQLRHTFNTKEIYLGVIC